MGHREEALCEKLPHSLGVGLHLEPVYRYFLWDWSQRELLERLDDGSYGMLFPVLWHLVGFDVDFVLHPLFAPGAIALILPDQKGMLLFFFQLPVLLHEPSHLFDNFPFSFQEHRLVNCWLINLIVQGQVVEVQQNSKGGYYGR